MKKIEIVDDNKPDNADNAGASVRSSRNRSSLAPGSRPHGSRMTTDSTGKRDSARSAHRSSTTAQRLLPNIEPPRLSTESTVLRPSDGMVPGELRKVLLEYSISYLVEQPSDLISFSVDYFNKLQDSRRRSTMQSADEPNSESQSEEDEEEGTVENSVEEEGQNDNQPNDPAENWNLRRKSVFAESYDPEADSDDENVDNVIPKTSEQRIRLAESIKNTLLFRSLEEEQINKILDVMFERHVEAGEYVIRQGDDGDNFYVIESGTYSVFVNDKLVNTYDNKGIFGELALMYNVPRAASVRADTTGLLWAMDRNTFRRMLLKHAFKKRKMYESLLNSVPMLETLENYERMNLADALVSKRFNAGEIIIAQNDIADGMYFIEDGTVTIRMLQDNREIEISQLSTGEFFGELALLTHRPRAASVYAATDVKVAFLETEAFERILGSLKDILRKRVSTYAAQLTKLAEEPL